MVADLSVGNSTGKGRIIQDVGAFSSSLSIGQITTQANYYLQSTSNRSGVLYESKNDFGVQDQSRSAFWAVGGFLSSGQQTGGFAYRSGLYTDVTRSTYFDTFTVDWAGNTTIEGFLTVNQGARFNDPDPFSQVIINNTNVSPNSTSLLFQEDGVFRFGLADSIANGTFSIDRYNALGLFQDSPLIVRQSDGAVVLANTLEVDTLDDRTGAGIEFLAPATFTAITNFDDDIRLFSTGYIAGTSNQVLENIDWRGNNTAASTSTFARIVPVTGDQTAGSENAFIDVRAMDGGSLDAAFRFADGPSGNKVNRSIYDLQIASGSTLRTDTLDDLTGANIDVQTGLALGNNILSARNIQHYGSTPMVLGVYDTVGGTLGANIEMYSSTGSFASGMVLDADQFLVRPANGTGLTSFTIQGNVFTPNLPTSDPLVAGQQWNNNGVVTVSAG